jgi:hypothetical protein
MFSTPCRRRHSCCHLVSWFCSRSSISIGLCSILKGALHFTVPLAVPSLFIYPWFYGQLLPGHPHPHSDQPFHAWPLLYSMPGLSGLPPWLTFSAPTFRMQAFREKMQRTRFLPLSFKWIPDTIPLFFLMALSQGLFPFESKTHSHRNTPILASEKNQNLLWTFLPSCSSKQTSLSTTNILDQALPFNYTCLLAPVPHSDQLCHKSEQLYTGKSCKYLLPLILKLLCYHCVPRHSPWSATWMFWGHNAQCRDTLANGFSR